MTRPSLPTIAVLFAAQIAAVPAFADCASDAEVAAFAAAFEAHMPAHALALGGSMDDALCTQAKLVDLLSAQLGPVVGYKAGLTSKPAQERFGASEPVRGVLYRDMLLADGAEVPVSFGTVPMVEADLILVVGDDGINAATNPQEVMAHVSEVRPFIELPDITLGKGEPITPVTLTAMGVGIRLGVMGAGIAVTDPEAMTEALGEMQVSLRGGDGKVVVEAPGKAVLGHPANSVLWLAANGVTFREGDLVSVGSFGPLTPAARMAGGASVTYEGLPGDPVVSVTFAQ